jgi:hypothetical protein
MLNRRDAMNRLALGGAMTGLSGAAAAESLAGEAAQESTTVAMGEVARAVREIREEIARQVTFWEIAPVRNQMRAFLRANSKFPDAIEVGSDVWHQVYDWHVRYQQPLTVGRTPDARYTISLMGTLVILRPDLAPGFVGVPYDNR